MNWGNPCRALFPRTSPCGLGRPRNCASCAHDLPYRRHHPGRGRGYSDESTLRIAAAPKTCVRTAVCCQQEESTGRAIRVSDRQPIHSRCDTTATLSSPSPVGLRRTARRGPVAARLSRILVRGSPRPGQSPHRGTAGAIDAGASAAHQQTRQSVRTLRR